MESRQNKKSGAVNIILIIIISCLLIAGYFLYKINKKIDRLENDIFYLEQYYTDIEKNKKEIEKLEKEIKSMDWDIETIKEDIRDAGINYSEQRIQNYYKKQQQKNKTKKQDKNKQQSIDIFSVPYLLNH